MSVAYLFESAFCLACAYVFYWLLLRRETFFLGNRIYLLLAPALCLIAPALHIRWEAPPPGDAHLIAETQAPVWPVLIEQWQTAPRAMRHALTQTTPGPAPLTAGELLWYIYLAGCAVLGLRLLLRLWRVFSVIRACRPLKTTGDLPARVQLLDSDRESVPVASFFGYIFWKSDGRASKEDRMILEHELAHVRQWHSADVLLIESLAIIQWFNPLIYAFRRSLRAVHEYLADDYVVRNSRRRYEYAALLAHQASAPASVSNLTHTFSSSVKNRLLMLSKRPSQPWRSAKYALALPLFASLTLLFSFRLVERAPLKSAVQSAVRNVETSLTRLGQTPVVSAVGEAPTYTFYWGGWHAKLREANGLFVGEAHISPAEWKQSIKHAPRLWNGEDIEQRVAFRLETQTIEADKNDASVYQGHLPGALEFTQNIGAGIAYFRIEQLILPNGKKGEIHVFLDVPNSKSDVNDVSKAAPAAILWGRQTFTRGERRYSTPGQFAQLMEKQPELIYSDGRNQIPEKWNWALIGREGSIKKEMRKSADQALSWAALQAEISAAQSEIKTGSAIWLGAWDAAERPNILETDLITFEITHFTDPRLLLRDAERHDFSFEWGPFKQRLPALYGIAFQGDGYRYNADKPVQYIQANFTREEVLRILRQPARFYRDGAPYGDFNFTLDHKGYGYLIENGMVPKSYIAYMEKNLKAGDVLDINALQGRGFGPHYLIITPFTPSDDALSCIPPDGIERINIYKNEQKEAMLGVLVKNEYVKKVKACLGDQNKQVYWQYGESTLSDVQIRIQVRSDQAGVSAKPIQAPPPHVASWGLQVTPNPARDQFTLRFDLPEAAKGRLQISNAMGQIVYAHEADFQAGPNSHTLSARDISAKGALFAILETPQGRETYMFMVE